MANSQSIPYRQQLIRVFCAVSQLDLSLLSPENPTPQLKRL
ncbi:hypothetical protein FDUTEX481_08294 [Tolypothrix sp. PCC 7601]|nr:hypothetical protein FDUTEX481_08294 [Tolypothrix sp. PCC 7601]